MAVCVYGGKGVRNQGPPSPLLTKLTTPVRKQLLTNCADGATHTNVPDCETGFLTVFLVNPDQKKVSKVGITFCTLL